MEMKSECTNFAEQSKTGPQVHIGHVVFRELREINLKSVQAHVPTQDQQIVHEFPDILNRSRVLKFDDAQAC
jgi:hypothetical protein